MIFNNWKYPIEISKAFQAPSPLSKQKFHLSFLITRKCQSQVWGFYTFKINLNIYKVLVVKLPKDWSVDSISRFYSQLCLSRMFLQGYIWWDEHPSFQEVWLCHRISLIKLDIHVEHLMFSSCWQTSHYSLWNKEKHRKTKASHSHYCIYYKTLTIDSDGNM